MVSEKNISDAMDQLMKDLQQDEKLHTLIKKFVFEVCRSMQRIKLQPGIELMEI